MSIEIGTRVEIDSYGELVRGTVVAVASKRVARAGRGSGMNQADRNGMDTRSVPVYSVVWDGDSVPGEYRDFEISTITETE